MVLLDCGRSYASFFWHRQKENLRWAVDYFDFIYFHFVMTSQFIPLLPQPLWGLCQQFNPLICLSTILMLQGQFSFKTVKLVHCCLCLCFGTCYKAIIRLSCKKCYWARHKYAFRCYFKITLSFVNIWQYRPYALSCSMPRKAVWELLSCSNPRYWIHSWLQLPPGTLEWQKHCLT